MYLIDSPWFCWVSDGFWMDLVGFLIDRVWILHGLGFVSVKSAWVWFDLWSAMSLPPVESAPVAAGTTEPMKHRGLQTVRLMPRRRKLGSQRLSQDFWRAVRLKAVSLPRPGDYLVHVAANDNYFISASEYQTKYLELGTWTADVALSCMALMCSTGSVPELFWTRRRRSLTTELRGIADLLRTQSWEMVSTIAMSGPLLAMPSGQGQNMSFLGNHKIKLIKLIDL